MVIVIVSTVILSVLYNAPRWVEVYLDGFVLYSNIGNVSLPVIAPTAMRRHVNYMRVDSILYLVIMFIIPFVCVLSSMILLNRTFAVSLSP